MAWNLLLTRLKAMPTELPTPRVYTGWISEA